MQTIIDEISAQNGDYKELCDHPQRTPAWHATQGSKIQIGLMIIARAGACKLRGNKTRDKNATHQEITLCDLCAREEPEDETHILIDCPYYATWRRKMWTKAPTSVTRAMPVSLGAIGPLCRM